MVEVFISTHHIYIGVYLIDICLFRTSCERLFESGAQVDLLKIDVDSIPHDELLRALLAAGLDAKVLHTEIAPWFPPPVKYWRDYVRDSTSQEDLESHTYDIYTKEK